MCIAIIKPKDKHISDEALKNCYERNPDGAGLAFAKNGKLYIMKGIFNSNLRIERFLKNYECVLALLDYTKENEQNTLPVCNTVGFIEYVYSHSDKYENLYNFFVERQIKEHYKNGYDEHEIERVA